MRKKYPNQRVYKENKKKIIIAGIIVFVLILAFVLRMFFNSESKEVQKGVSYLKKLEQKDLGKTEKKVKEARENAMVKAMESGEISVWEQFNDAVIFGDSRSVGFKTYELIDKQRVLAEKGYILTKIKDYYENIRTLNPSYLFLCTGANDLKYWTTPEEYVKAYETQVLELTKEFPELEIYINSILPMVDDAEEWQSIPQYNEALKKWCEENGYVFIDNQKVFDEHKDLYEPDGIHFKKEFLEYWAYNMISQVNA